MNHTISNIGPIVVRKWSPTGRAMWMNVNPQLTIEIESLTDCDRLLDAVMAVKSELHRKKALQSVGT